MSAPREKKMRLLSEGSSSNVSVRKSFEIKEVLDDSLLVENIDVKDVVICDILEKKKTSSLLRDLSQTFPLGEMQHLRRVKSNKDKDSVLQIIVCDSCYTLQHNIYNDVHTFLKSKNISSDGLGPWKIVQVAKYPPKTKQQYEKAKVLWPTNFHEDKQLTKSLQGALFLNEEFENIQKHMYFAVNIAKIGRTKNKVSSVGAVVVNSQNDEVVAACFDCCHGNHPLHHAVMVAIDLVARSQGAGVYTYPAEDSFLINVLEMSETSAKESLPYLCTTFDLYVTKEPCIMCAMALVHSRIHRVFYGIVSPDGALGSKYKLHLQSGLNHHFQVFRGVLQSDCHELHRSQIS